MTDPANNRTPPFSEDAEIAVLGAMFFDDKGMAEVRAVLPASAFCLRRNRVVYEAMIECHEDQVSIDPITVSNRIKLRYRDHTDDPDIFDLTRYIGWLLDAVPTAANAVHHAKIVTRFAAQRDLIAKVTAAVDLAWSGKQDPTKLAQQLVDQLLPVAAPTGHQGYANAKEFLLQVANEIEERRHRKGLIGVPCGFPEIDNHTGGWRPGELVAICGVPKAGKSVVLQNFAQNNVLDGIDVGFVAAEMTRAEMLERMMANIAGVTTVGIRNGRISDADMDRIGKAAVRISKGGEFFIDETPGQSLSEVVAKARALKIRHPSIAVIYVDYLQLIHAEDENRAEELRQISYGLKDLAKQLQIPIIVAAQLNGKAISQRQDKRPTPDDVQGSSGLHQAVHYLALLFRPSMYEHVHHDRVELEFAATRSVGVFTATLDAELQYMRLRSSHNPKPAPRAQQEDLNV